MYRSGKAVRIALHDNESEWSRAEDAISPKRVANQDLLPPTASPDCSSPPSIVDAAKNTNGKQEEKSSSLLLSMVILTSMDDGVPLPQEREGVTSARYYLWLSGNSILLMIERLY